MMFLTLVLHFECDAKRAPEDYVSVPHLVQGRDMNGMYVT